MICKIFKIFKDVKGKLFITGRERIIFFMFVQKSTHQPLDLMLHSHPFKSPFPFQIEIDQLPHKLSSSLLYIIIINEISTLFYQKCNDSFQHFFIFLLYKTVYSLENNTKNLFIRWKIIFIFPDLASNNLFKEFVSDFLGEQIHLI